MDTVKNALKNMNFNTNTLIKYISSPVGMYIIWIILHYVSAHLYKLHCAPSGIWGFILSPLMASTPYCTGLVWVLQNSVLKFMAIWTIVGSWISYNLNKNTNNTSIDENREKED